ncbi:MAG TPA: hypothetical protein VGD35_04865 [Chitinophaga sp.]
MSKTTLALVLGLLFNVSCKSPTKKNVHFRNYKVHIGDSVEEVDRSINMRRDEENDDGNGIHYIAFLDDASDIYQLCVLHLTFSGQTLVRFEAAYTFGDRISNSEIKILSKEIPLLKGSRGPVWEKEEDGVRYAAHIGKLPSSGNPVLYYEVTR